MKFIYYILIVEDNHGNKDAGVVADMSDTIQICGMKKPNGEPIYFESDAYHLPNFCKGEGLTLKEIKKEETV